MPVPDFSPGEVLTAAAMDSIGLWLVKTQTIGAGVASIPVTDAFSANFDNYKIIVSGGVSSAAGSLLNMTLGSTVTGYYWSGGVSLMASDSLTPLREQNAASWSRVGVGNPNSINGEIELFCPNLAKRTIYNARYVQNVTDGNVVFSGGYVDNATQYTGFTLTAGSGTFTGGTIRVYGYRN